MIEPLDPPVVRVAGGLILALAAGTGVRIFALRGAPDEEVRSRLDSLKVWWGVVAVVLAALLLGSAGVVALLAGVSALGLREFFRLAGLDRSDRRLGWEALVLVAAGYGAVVAGRGDLLLTLLPPVALVWIAASLALRGRVEGFARVGGAWLSGVLLVGWAPAHAALLYTPSAPPNPAAGPAGWLLLLLVLDQMNDILQALVGRRLGRRPIAPELSPKKTWAGFAGGLAGTPLLALALAATLTPVGPVEACGVGVAVALSGSLGDLTISGIKREAGADDSGALLPGHGGMLDRVDSLLLSAPVYFHLVRLLA